MEYFTLANGVKIPLIGYGPGIISSKRYEICRLRNGDLRSVINDCKSIYTLNHVSNSKFRLIDTSASYESAQEYIGKAISKKRKEFFIVSKASNKSQFSNDVEAEFYENLKKLKTDYVDLYLLHWPVPDRYLQSWNVLERLYEKGLCKSIGVANFNIRHLQHLSHFCSIKPMVNQIECHPLFTNKEVVDYCNLNGIRVMAYTPTARMDGRLKCSVIPSISKKYKKSMAQIILRWHVQVGNIPIVNTNNIKHLNENCDIFNFDLLDEEVKAIEATNINSRLRYDPDNCNFEML